jgi:hypothetical protein
MNEDWDLEMGEEDKPGRTWRIDYAEGWVDDYIHLGEAVQRFYFLATAIHHYVSV